MTLKNKGNDCFKAGKYAEAIKYYSEAIESCPADVSPADLSAFYQNRAAAQEKLVYVCVCVCVFVFHIVLEDSR